MTEITNKLCILIFQMLEIQKFGMFLIITSIMTFAYCIPAITNVKDLFKKKLIYRKNLIELNRDPTSEYANLQLLYWDFWGCIISLIAFIIGLILIFLF